MSNPVNVYRGVVFDLHQKVRDYIDTLNSDGQIDLDDHGYPYLVSVEKNGSNVSVGIVRNNQIVGFTMNPRRSSAAPVPTWNPNDGYVRKTKKQVIQMDQPQDRPRGERQRRVATEAFVQMVESMVR